MPQTLPIPQLCGQLIVAGFDGAELPPRLHEQLARGELGGVILFKRNLPSVEAAYDICRAAAAAVAPELAPFISVDQEGGRVVRLPDPVLRLPAMRVLGTIADPAMTRRAADLIGQQLAAIGFNLNFAPVLDVDTNPKNPIIGDRSFAPDPDVVARMGRAFIEGLQAEGVMACAKHFPGHGDTSKDSHVDLPTLSHDKQRLDAIELPPFRTASLRGVAAMMTAHILYPELDPGVPATLSHRICTGILRSEIGFSGVLFSDDLEMRALSDQLEIEQTAVGAVRAGCDALLICHDADLQERARVALITKAESDADFRNRCQQAVTRSLAARRRYPPRAAAHLSEVEALLAARTGAELIAEINARIGQ